ncbi:MAG: histidine ammonia-lyase [Bacteroides sp. SM23_62_1]|nr:MAG: histidine ammonia-lyase [Bacteroides sp. SM23_62_1]
MANIHQISPAVIDFGQISNIMDGETRLEISSESAGLIRKCRAYLDKKLSEEDKPFYGINTGFGSLHDCSISNGDLGVLQKNLVMSHACGQGEEVPREVVRLMLFLKIQSLAYGNSGVQLETVRRLVDFFNHGIVPVVYQYGSLGASGDLAPLAHMSLPLIGEGEVWYRNRKRNTMPVLKESGLEPLVLQSKEGLALLNGTQFMSAYGVYCCLRVFKLSKLADIIAAISLDAFDGKLEPFHPIVQKIRPYKGQIETARRIRVLLEGSELMSRPKKHVQDPYSFRCIPQVHGASKDSIHYVAYVFKNEINSVTDNPTIFPDEDLIISAGNFHGQPLALALDNLCIAMSELGSISERRTYQLVGGYRGLPPYLVAKPGLNSGFMIPQYTAASLVSYNKQLSTPASVDSIESCQGQEDHVSMGANAAIKAYQVLLNLERILAIELFNAAQAIEFRRPARTSEYLESFLDKYRGKVDFIDDDRIMYPDMNKSVDFLREVDLELKEGFFAGEY